MRALIVDDSRDMRRVLRSVMTEFGFEVAEADSGVSAMDALAQLGVPDIALVDWTMDKMSGIEFVRAVRADSKLSSMRLMMVTAKDDVSWISEALEAGADEFLMKPVDREALREKLELLGLRGS